MWKLLVFIVLVLCIDVIAQDDSPYPAITAENILELESVQQLSFEDDLYIPSLTLNNQNDLLDADIELGWFTYSSYADRFLLIDNTNTMQVVSSEGATRFSLDASNIIDAVSFGEGFYAILSTTSGGFSVRYDNLQFNESINLIVNVTSSITPSALWVTCPETSGENGIGCYATIEGFKDGTTRTLTLPIFDNIPRSNNVINTTDDELEQRPYLPANDTEAVVRIGRIPLPYVVTSSVEGIVKLWDLDTDELAYEVDNGTGEPSVFGNINADATHLVWRDNANQTLYLLNFETGENREIASLNGEYAQWYFLTNDASAVIAVNLGGEPNVVVWDASTGERMDLGNYRECERPQPDMVRLTEDGTTLIIGCDTGLDIWRINLEG